MKQRYSNKVFKLTKAERKKLQKKIKREILKAYKAGKAARKLQEQTGLKFGFDFGYKPYSAAVFGTVKKDKLILGHWAKR